MLNKNTLMSLIMAAFMLFSPAAFAVDSSELIEARQGLMKLYSVNMDMLGEMIRRIQPYDKKKAKDAADNLLALSRLKQGALWPTGTGLASKSLGTKTSAKPEIWIQKENVAQKQKDLVAALEILSRDAGWSLRNLEDSITAVNKACKGCHKDFRARK
ncbi:MAG: cytochrome c [Gammaproteobacteria bacterium]|nr:cytochrome c [Gammaproteobacteria bacterium]